MLLSPYANFQLHTGWPTERYRIENAVIIERKNLIFMLKPLKHIQITRYKFSFSCSYSISTESLLKLLLHTNHWIIFNKTFHREIQCCTSTFPLFMKLGSIQTKPQLVDNQLICLFQYLTKFYQQKNSKLPVIHLL